MYVDLPTWLLSLTRGKKSKEYINIYIFNNGGLLTSLSTSSLRLQERAASLHNLQSLLLFNGWFRLCKLQLFILNELLNSFQFHLFIWMSLLTTCAADLLARSPCKRDPNGSFTGLNKSNQWFYYYLLLLLLCFPLIFLLHANQIFAYNFLSFFSLAVFSMFFLGSNGRKIFKIFLNIYLNICSNWQN